MEINAKFKNYIKSLKEEDNIAIFYHAFCTDGLCSCVIISKAIEKITKIKPKYHIHHKFYEITDETIDFIKKEKIKKAIFVDISLDAKPEKITEAGQYADILIIDHHKFKKDLNSDKITFVHSEIIKKDLDGAKYPASKLVYDLFSEIENISYLDWLSAIGLVSDMGYNQWPEFVNNVQIKYNLKTDKEVFKTEIGKAGVLINTSKMISNEKDTAFDIIYNAKSINDILENETLKKFEFESKKEIDKFVKESNNAERHGNLIIYQIEPKYKIGSTLSTILSIEKFKDKTVIVIEEENGRYKISARDQTQKINLNDFLKELTKDFENSSAGGHIPAAGAKIMKKDLKLFKERLIENYNNLNK